MNGFTLRLDNKIISAALNSGSLGFIISNKGGEFTLCFNGVDEQRVIYTWFYDKLNVGDSFLISYEEIDSLTISIPINIRDVNNKEDEECQLLLNSYCELRQELLDEGLIIP